MGGSWYLIRPTYVFARLRRATPAPVPRPIKIVQGSTGVSLARLPERDHWMFAKCRIVVVRCS